MKQMILYYSRKWLIGIIITLHPLLLVNVDSHISASF